MCVGVSACVRACVRVGVNNVCARARSRCVRERETDRQRHRERCHDHGRHLWQECQMTSFTSLESDGSSVVRAQDS